MNGYLNSLCETVFNGVEDIYRDILRKTPLKRKLVFLKTLSSNYNFIEIERKTLSLDEISAQYNPERFKQYKSVYKGADDGVLDMNQSPHCKLLTDYYNKGDNVWKNFSNHPYYLMQRRYGKSRKSAFDKAKRLTALFDEIKTNGFKGRISVIEKPIVSNPYNNGYEIYDGHHRAACCIVLGIKNIEAIILKAVPKEQPK